MHARAIGNGKINCEIKFLKLAACHMLLFTEKCIYHTFTDTFKGL